MRDEFKLADGLWIAPRSTPGYLGFGAIYDNGGRLWEERHAWVHPNGFIQVPIDEDRRLHFWGHPRIPRQIGWFPIHDHRWGFKSEVIGGRMMNIVYNTQVMGDDSLNTYEVWSPDGPCKKSNLADTGKRVRLNSNWPNLVNSGYHYTMQPFVFHESLPLRPSVTLMTKVRAPLTPIEQKMQPRILIPRGRVYDQEFMRLKWDHPGEQAMLWTIIASIIEEIA